VSTAAITKLIIFVIVALISGLVSQLYQKNKRVEAGRVTQVPAAPGGVAQTADVVRQRPAGLVKVLFVFFLVLAVILVLIGIVVPDVVAKIFIVLLGLLSAGVSVFVLQSYRNCSLVDAPHVTITTDWRGRETQLRHDEIASYRRAYRQRTVTIKDVHGKKHNINLAWFSAPVLALQVARMEAEGRFAVKNLGKPDKISGRLTNVEWCFFVSLPDQLKAVLALGPGSYPTMFQRDPAAPEGQGWAGPGYDRWLADLDAAMHA